MSHILNLARKSGTFRDIFFRYTYVYAYRKTKEILGHFFRHMGHFLGIWADRTFFRHLWVFLVYW